MTTKKGLLLITAVLVFSLLLSACATPTVDDVLEETTEEPTAEVTEEATEEPTEEPTAEPTEEATEEPTPEPTEEVDETAALDENISAFLSGMEGYNATNPAAVSEMQVEGEEFFLLDVRNPSELEENGYIEGAVNIPLKELAQNVDKLPSLDTPIVVYCAAGTRASIGTMALGELGFTDVKSMMGGSFGGWVEAEYPVVEGLPEEAPVLDEAEIDEAVVETVDAMLQSYPDGWAQISAEDLNSELVEGAELTLIDVRRAEEVAENGQIEGAVNIPLEQLMEMQAEWPSQDEDIVIYCAAGYRGNLAMSIMRAYGYEDIRNLSGGFGAWTAAELPVVEGSGEASTGAGLDENASAFLSGMEGYNVTTPANVSEMQVEGEEFFLLDVRNPSELEEGGYIEGAVNIPLKELAQNVDMLPSLDTPIVVYCAAGTRAAIGMVALGEMGFTDVVSMQGGSFGGWVEAGYPVVEGTPEEVVLDEAEVDADVVAAVDAMLQSYPDGWAQLAAEDLNSELLDGAELTLIDVRRAEEVAENGQIEGAVNIPLEELMEMQAEWPAQDEDIVIYCAAGYRGNLAMSIMRAYGYENIRNLKGGFGAWSEAGLPVVTD